LAPDHRGWLALDRLEATTDFPLGLARVTLSITHPGARTLVSPSLDRGRAGVIGARRGDVRRLTAPKGRGEEAVEARDYLPGDDARWIDWKAAARAGRLMLRDRRGDPPKAIRVHLERRGAEGAEFEKRVSRAAGAAAQALANGEAVGFASDELELLPRSGPAQRRKILEYLALVEPHA
jgi:uncharacterized protein (DUF58 family)